MATTPKRLRVLLLVDQLSGLGGGAEVFLVGLATHLPRERFEVARLRDVAQGEEAPDLMGKAFQLAALAAGDEYLRTFRAKAACDDLAHVAASGGTEHHCGFALETSHLIQLRASNWTHLRRGRTRAATGATARSAVKPM